MNRVRALVSRFAEPATPVAATAGLHFEPVLANDALRLIEVAHHAGDVSVLVEVQPGPRWSDEPWAGAQVRGGVHILAADGATIDRDGPRSDIVPLPWAGVRAPL